MKHGRSLPTLDTQPLGPGIEIEYCVPCGLLPAAEETAHAILEPLAEQVSGLRLVPGRGGIFKVRADGEVIFDKARDGYDVEEIVSRVARRVGQHR